MRPKYFPFTWGLSSENAAHRIAVTWGDDKEGVFVPRRDTDSFINQVVGGKIFPGEQHAADFHVQESAGQFDFNMKSNDQEVEISFSGEVVDKLPSTSCFKTLKESSVFSKLAH